MTQSASMYHVAYLIHVFSRNEKGLLNFESERIKHVYKINLLGTSLKNMNCLSDFWNHNL